MFEHVYLELLTLSVVITAGISKRDIQPATKVFAALLLQAGYLVRGDIRHGKSPAPAREAINRGQ